MTKAMAHRSSPRSDAGFALIEVIVSCAVLAIVAMAVLSGIDAASNSSGREKARAVAASLAEQDQERMRSMAINELSNFNPEPATTTIEGVTYKIKSQGRWITDDQGGTPSCGNSSKNNEYVHISTTVTSAVVGRNIDPVQIDSLVAPSVAWSNTHGVLGVKVVNRNGVGVQGVTVSPSKTDPAFAPASQQTDAAGCALFRQLPVGTYTIKIVKAGFVDPDGNAESTTTQKVSAGVVSFKTMDFDIATSATLSISTNVPGSPNNEQASRTTVVSATNAKRVSLLRKFPSATAVSSLSGGSLFPFKDTAYSFFTGNCAYTNPALLDGNANYFRDYPGAMVMDPTVGQPQWVKVRQPPFNLRIASNADGSSFSNSNLIIWAKLVKPATTDDACVEPRMQMALKPWPNPVGTWGNPPGTPSLPTTNWVGRNDATNFDPGMPYGTYTICLHDTKNSRYQTFPYDNTDPGGAATTRTNPTSTTNPSSTTYPWRSSPSCIPAA